MLPPTPPIPGSLDGCNEHRERAFAGNRPELGHGHSALAARLRTQRSARGAGKEVACAAALGCVPAACLGAAYLARLGTRTGTSQVLAAQALFWHRGGACPPLPSPLRPHCYRPPVVRPRSPGLRAITFEFPPTRSLLGCHGFIHVPRSGTMRAAFGPARCEGATAIGTPYPTCHAAWETDLSPRCA